MKNILSLLFIICLMSSCKNEPKDNSNTDTVSRSTGVSKNCLTQLNLSYQELLPLDYVTELLALEVTDIKTDSINQKNQYGKVSYSWKSDRPDMSNPIIKSMKIPDNNSVGISGLHAHDESMPLQQIIDNFEMGYKQLSDQEIAAIDKNIEKHLEDKVPEERQAVEGLVNTRKENAFEKITDLGQSAFWKFNPQNGGKLVVLSGNEEFTIYTKISLEATENLILAKKLAQSVLSKCSYKHN